MAMGCAVIRSKAPGWHEMADYADIIEIGDAEALRRRIEDAVRNDFYPDRTKRAQEAVRLKFTKEVMCEKTVDVYRKIMEK